MDHFTLIGGVAVLLICGLAGGYLHRRLLSDLRQQLAFQLERANQAEKDVHLKEMEFLEARNRKNVEHADALADVRAAAFDEGRRQAKAEAELDISIRLVEQSRDLDERFRREKALEIKESVDRVRAEYELQSKLFSVRVGPYVNIEKINGFMSHSYEASIGYQYQLLVNDIPAFRPHVIIERHESAKVIDDEFKKKLLDAATSIAQLAVGTYLGKGTGVAKLVAATVIEGKK